MKYIICSFAFAIIMFCQMEGVLAIQCKNKIGNWKRSGYNISCNGVVSLVNCNSPNFTHTNVDCDCKCT